jgi:hypothetical protein
MVDWEVTATTIYCESVDDEVTLIISGEGAVKCTGRQKYENPQKEAKKTLKTKRRNTGKQLNCKGAECGAVKQYREKMMGGK